MHFKSIRFVFGLIYTGSIRLSFTLLVHTFHGLLLPLFSLVLRLQVVDNLIDALVCGILWEALNLGERSFFKIDLVFLSIEHAFVVDKNFLWQPL